MKRKSMTEAARDARARRAAKRVGLVARKSKRYSGSIHNFGGFQFVDP